MDNKKTEGVSIIITAYKREKSLRKLIHSIEKQYINFPYEIIIINNDVENKIERSKYFNRLSKQIRRISNVIIINNTNNDGCWVRFKFASALAHYDKIIFFDDDIILNSKTFIKEFSKALDIVNKNDIISCWCSSFKKDKIDYFDTTLYTCLQNNIQELLTEVDLIGPGMSIMRKSLLTEELTNIPEQYWLVDNVWLSLMSSILSKTRKYYFKSFEMINFSNEYNNEFAMFSKKETEIMKTKSVNNFIEKGYVPLFKLSN